MDEQNDGAYADYFTERWAMQERFINLEHDVIPWPGALEEIWECPEDWCSYGYDPGEILPLDGGYLNCIKFSARLIEATKDIWVPPLSPRRHWNYVDVVINEGATAAGFQFHQHFPSVVHGNPDAYHNWRGKYY